MSIELKSSVGEKASNMPKFGTKIQTIKYLSLQSMKKFIFCSGLNHIRKY